MPTPSQHTVTLLLNQQQLQLMDNTVAKGAAPDRVALVRQADLSLSDEALVLSGNAIRLLSRKNATP